jgi:hypothetical protein
MPRGAGSQKRKKRGSGDDGMSFGPSMHNVRPRGKHHHLSIMVMTLR